MNNKSFYTTGEISELLNISRATVSRKFDEGILKGKKNPITKGRLISRESIIAFAQRYNVQLPIGQLPIGRSNQKKVVLLTKDTMIKSLVENAIGADKQIRLEVISSGCEALIKSAKESCNLLIIDEEIPDVLPIEIIKALRRIRKESDLKIISCLNTDKSDMYLESGANDYYVKNETDQETLRKKLIALLELSDIAAGIREPYTHKREWPRMSVNLPAAIELYSPDDPEYCQHGTAVIENISRGGAYLSRIQLDKDFIPSKSFRVRVNVNEGVLSDWQADAKVVRFEFNDHLSICVQFVDLSSQNEEKIMKLFN
jgi:CheY-like chemotaxis protein